MNSSGCKALGASPGEPSNTCLYAPYMPAAVDGATEPKYGVVTDDDVSFSNYNTFVVSSALDRSILSARSFMTGAARRPRVLPRRGPALLPRGTKNCEGPPHPPSFVTPHCSSKNAPAARAGVFPDVNVPRATPYGNVYLPDGAQPVPIYTAAGADADDILVRAYTKCPAFEKRLAAWYASGAFAAKAAETAAFRNSIGALLQSRPTGVAPDVRLENWYNVYDQFNVYLKTGAVIRLLPGRRAAFAWNGAITSCAGGSHAPSLTPPAAPPPGHGDPMPAVNASTYAQIAALASWLETSKMASSLTGSLLSAPLLADLSSRLATAAAVGASMVPDAMYPRLVVVSGHYNVQLALIGSMRLDALLSDAQVAAARWVTAASGKVTGSIPAAAAVLAFELHQSIADNKRRARDRARSLGMMCLLGHQHGSFLTRGFQLRLLLPPPPPTLLLRHPGSRSARCCRTGPGSPTQPSRCRARATPRRPSGVSGRVLWRTSSP